MNLTGSENVVRAALAAGVPHLVHLSSVGAYAYHPVDDARVDESWPADGISPSQYSREKAAVESHLDTVERDHPELLVTRVRPALVFQRDAGSEIARYFLGAFVPTRLLRRVPLPVLPLPSVCGSRWCTPTTWPTHWPASWNGHRVVRSTWRTNPSCGAGTWRCR